MAQSLIIGVAKTTIIVATFILGCLSILYSQLLGLVIGRLTNTEVLQSWMSHTKENFIVLLVQIITFASNTNIHVRLSSSNLSKDRFGFQHGRLTMVMSPYSLSLANHQIYTDWVYLWWLAQSGSLGGFVYIMLKAELKNIPLLGFGMKCFEFIFLSRKWDSDKVTMGNQLDIIDANARGRGPANGVVLSGDQWPQGKGSKRWPYQLVIFPEGTNLSDNTRQKTEQYASKVGKPPFKHVLLPKTTGLRFSLLKLQGSLEEVYDYTVGYSGVKPEEYGQDIYTLYETFLKGRNPEMVDIHIRAIPLSSIPLGKLTYEDPEEEKKAIKEFEDWVYEIWETKDQLMDEYYKSGRFIAENTIETELKTSKFKFMQIFYSPLITIMLIRCCWVLYKLFT